MGSAAVAEGDSSPNHSVRIPVTVTPASGLTTLACTISLSGDATLGDDYRTSFGATLTINTSANITGFNLTVEADTVVESDETVTIKLDSCSGTPATITQPDSMVTIINDD
jgi:hypothetical protein